MALTKLPGFTLDSTSSFTFANATVTANVSAGNIKTDNILYANGSPWSFGSTYGNSNVEAYLPTYTGQMANSLVAGTVYTGAQPNITSVGTLVNLTASGLITATAGGIKVGNLQDTSGTNTIRLTNSDIFVTGNINAGAGGTGNVTATYFIGNGSQLTGLPATYSNTNVADYLPTYTGNVSANYFIGNGSTLTNIVAGNIDGQVANSLVAGTVYTNAQPNITSVGTLSSLSVTANITAGNITSSGALAAADLSTSGNAVIAGNLTVGGTTSYVNVTTLAVKDPIIEMGGGTNNAPLTTNDGKDRGSLLHYYTTTPVDAFMGWDNSNAEFAFGSNVSMSGEVATFNTFGNVRAGYFLGNGSQLTGVAATTATTAETVTTAAQPNITSVGTLASVSVTGNVSSSGNIIGNGQYLTSITGGNVTGQVANSLVAGTVYTNAQPNITSLGTLASLSVTANITSGNINGGNAVVANYFVGDGSLLTGLPASYSNTNVAAYLPTYSGNLSATNVSFTGSNVSLGSVSNLHITGGSANYVLTTDGAGSLSWAAQSGGGSSSTTISVDNFTGNGVADTYTLSVTPTSVNSVFVNYNGAFVGRGSYSLSGANLTFGSIPANGASIEVTTIEGLTIGSGAFTARTATGDGATTDYTVTSGATESSVLATLDGVLQTPTTDYTISGSTLTFTTAPYNGAAIQIRELSVASSSGGGASNTSIRAQAMTMGIIFGG